MARHAGWRPALGALLAVLSLGCRAPTPDRAAGFVLSTEHATRNRLADPLGEVSGLAMTPDGRLFAHGDETAHVYELDPRDGAILKRFQVGDPVLEDDFEGIAFDGERFLLMTSAGLLVTFPEGESEEAVVHAEHDPGLAERCEFEGLTFDRSAHALLLACKTPFAADLVDRFAVYRVDPTGRGAAALELTVSFSDLGAVGARGRFHPSGLAVHPVTGSLVVVAGPEQALIEVDRAGAFRSVARLPRSLHPQPEGIAFDSNGHLLIADEGRGGAPSLTRYAPESPAGEG